MSRFEKFLIAFMIVSVLVLVVLVVYLLVRFHTQTFNIEIDVPLVVGLLKGGGI